MALSAEYTLGGLDMNASRSAAWIGLLVSAQLGAPTWWSAANADMAGDEAALGAEDRVTRSAEGRTRERGSNALRDPLSLEQSSTAASDVVTIPKGSAATTSVAFGDSWIYDATAELFYDADGDGYFRYLRVRFDADSIYDPAYVYAVLYLSADGELWEEYFATEDIAIYGASPDDDYEVETELVTGYPAGLYDVLIELYDADYGVLVDEFGPAESASLALLPLEDARRDGVEPPISDDHGGGAASWAMLAALLGAVIVRRRLS
jgi:hypothetical protein